MKRILLAGADQNNSTDALIVEGVRRLLLIKYQDVDTKDYVRINDDQMMGFRDFYPAQQYDLIVYCGTPFLSDHIYNTPKFKNVAQLRSIHKDVPFIFMGIGVSMNLDKVGTEFLMDPKHVKKFQEFFEGSQVIVRDHIAKDVLDNAGVEATLLHCPAYFVNLEQNLNKTGPAMIFYDPRVGISRDDWIGPQHEAKWLKYASEFRDFYFNRDPDVYVSNVDDIPGCREIGLPEPKVLRTLNDVTTMIKKATFLLSGRVHNAIPADANDVLTVLMAVDSRAYTFYDFGGSVIFPGSPETLTRSFAASKSDSLKQYMELLP